MDKPYVEIVLDFLVDSIKKNDQVTIGQVKAYAKQKCNSATDRQIGMAIANYKRLGLITSDKKAIYKIKKNRIKAFYKRFKNNEITLWYDSLGQEKRPRGSIANKAAILKNSMMFRLRAIIATIDKPFTSKDLINIAQSHRLKVNKRATKNLFSKYGDCFDTIGKKGLFVIYRPNEKFFNRFADEKKLFVELLPDKKQVIESAFATQKPFVDTGFDMKAINSVLNDKLKPAKEKPADTPDQGPASKTEKYRPHLVIKAIFAAYKKPLTAPDIETIAKRHGQKVGRGSILWYVGGKSKQIIKNGNRGRAPLYSPAENFFDDNARHVETFIKILPDKKTDILTRFNMFRGNTKAAAAPAAGKEKSAPADPAPLTEENENDAQLAAGAQEKDQATDQQTSQGMDQDIDQNIEMIDAVNVGASILAYVSRLQKRLKQQPAGQSSEVEQIRLKYDDSKQTIINLRSQIQSLEGRVENLKQMVHANNQKIIALNHENSILKNAAQAEKRAVPSSFKVSEVARITSIVKGGRSNGGQ